MSIKPKVHGDKMLVYNTKCTMKNRQIAIENKEEKNFNHTHTHMFEQQKNQLKKLSL
jgi:hypothetical protein